jgi:hypothetical protein
MSSTIPSAMSWRASSVQSHCERLRPSGAGRSQARRTTCIATSGGKRPLGAAARGVREAFQALGQKPPRPTEFGARHARYERNYSGNNEQLRLDVLNFARGKGHLDGFKSFTDQCMSEYDLHGWTTPPWTWEPKER